MAKTATIAVQIDPHLKARAESVFAERGLTTSQAIALFYKQVELQRGLPFDIRLVDPPSPGTSPSTRTSSVLGKYACVPTSVDEFAGRKRDEKALEDPRA